VPQLRWHRTRFLRYRPTKSRTLLINGFQRIAVGIGDQYSRINLTEVINACLALIENRI